ncbi:MAG: phage portal protein [Oscillospiraceae bacterium]|nr:phage portal protein [Oscillospiraceae bacterium]
MNIFEKLAEEGYTAADPSFYNKIDEWHDWWAGDVKSFHYYTVFNGRKEIQQKRKTLNMPQQACADWADLLLNEKVKISCEEQSAQALLIDVLDKNNFWVRGNECVENAFWSGLAAIVPYPDGIQVQKESGEILGAEKIRLSYMCGREIIPLTIHNNLCTECAFLTDHTREKKVYSFLRMFIKGKDGKYICKNRLFENENGSIGEVNSICSVKGFENIADEWNTDSTEIPWVFIRPNKVNSISPNSPFGMAVFSDAISVCEGIDIIYDAYVNEFALGKTRVAVSAQTLMQSEFNKNKGKLDRLEQPAFDANDLVFYQLPGDPETPFIKEIQPDIRAQQMQIGINDNLNLYSIKCGFGEKHFRFDGTSTAATATEVISQNSKMFRTLKKHEIVLEAALKHLCKLILLMGRDYLKKPLNPDAEIVIDFDDSIIEDTQATLNDMRMDVASGILKPEYYLSKKYGVTEEEAKGMMPDFDREEEIGVENV